MQDELHPPQFLFRDGDHLILVNGETGDAVDLPDIEVEDTDQFEWSRNGEYLLALLGNSETHFKCLNLYDVDEQVWLFDEPLACNVEDGAFSHDDTQLAYASNNSINGALWIYTVEDAETRQLYVTSGGEELYPSGIDDINWSPTDSYLTFIEYHWLTGGTSNGLRFLNVERGTHYTLTGGFGYYANYYPIWSPDDQWFLTILQEEYATTAAMPYTNHRGGLYLVHAIDGETQRLTYSPADPETNIRWTEDGNIEFDTVEHVTLSVEDAMRIPWFYRIWWLREEPRHN
jgi:hypothetical protein